jgi:serine/threonine protein kinase
MELLHGISLARHLDAHQDQGRRLSAAETAQLVRHVARALILAHRARIVHRNLSPANIFLVPEGASFVAKVLDFGVAKWSTEPAPGSGTAYTLLGTAHYVSPEQFENARNVNHRADLWSLGVIAFECLTGQVPFPGESYIDVAFRVCKQGPLVASELANVPTGFDAWFARATARAREERFASALELAEALDGICSVSGEPAAFRGPPPCRSEPPSATQEVPPPAREPAPVLTSQRPSERRERNVALALLVMAVAAWGVLRLWSRSAATADASVAARLLGHVADAGAGVPLVPPTRHGGPAPGGFEPPPDRRRSREPTDCRAPYWIDARGVRRFKLDCL